MRWLMLIWLLAGCDKIPYGSNSISTMQLGMDGVKLIARGEEQGDAPGHFNQITYPISPSQRLLLRFESFQSEISRIDVEGSHRVWVELTTVAVSEKASALRLCPLTRSWMMLATWKLGHPFGKEGRWQNEGGDYDPSGCVAASETKEPTVNLRFDVTEWFKAYPRGRGENFGFLLLAEESVVVYGDGAGHFAPRFSFDSYYPKGAHLLSGRKGTGCVECQSGYAAF